MIKDEYEKLVEAHQAKFPQFDVERFNSYIKTENQMKRVIKLGVAQVNKGFRKKRNFENWCKSQ